MRIARVVLDIPTTALDQAYTYSLPEKEEAGDFSIEVGCAVLVPFGEREAIGFVVELGEEDEVFGAPGAIWIDNKIVELKSIIRAITTPYFSRVGAQCAQWLSERYVAPLSTCVRLFTPPGAIPKMVRTRGFWEVQQAAVGEVDDRWVIKGPAFETFTPKKNAYKQMAILEVLARGEVRVAELTTEYGSVSQVLKTLEKQGAVVVEHRRRYRESGLPKGDATFVPSARPVLTPSQEAALVAIQARQASGGGTVLVDGVTGSGKTEVYLRAIEEVLAQGKTALVLVPEISLTPQTVARFRGRFGQVVAVLHSKMTAGERYDQWDYIRSGKARVVVGARSALFSPMENLGIIVIDEEHEHTYKQDSQPRYVTRDVAAWFAKHYGCTLVLGSATPSLETLYQAQTDPAWSWVTLPERANGKALPPVTVVDRSAEFRSGLRSAVFSGPLRAAMAEALAQGEKCILFLNQRGYATSLLCRDCGYVPTCEECAVSFTYHRVGRYGPHLECHHCGHTEAVPPACPSCGSVYIRQLGTGTQQVEEHLRAFVAELEGPAKEARVIRMDADATKTKGAHQQLLEQFAAPGPAVLIGTQMIAKGLDFKQVTLVGVISADNMLSIPDFRAAERTFSLIEQVAGRAGRGELPGRVIVQTYRPEEAAIQSAKVHSRDLFLADELPKRKLLGYPPYTRLTNLVCKGPDDERVFAALEQVRASLVTLCEEVAPEGTGNLSQGKWNVSPVAACVFGKVQNAYRYHLVVKTALDFPVSEVCTRLVRGLKLPQDVTLSVDIDALNLL